MGVCVGVFYFKSRVLPTPQKCEMRWVHFTASAPGAENPGYDTDNMRICGY